MRDGRAIRQIREHLRRKKAIGRLYDLAGQPISALLGPGGSKGAEGLNEQYHKMNFVYHVEPTVTAIMRQRRLRDAVLYLNMPPCGGDEGCWENLRATLPVGYTLTVVHVRERDMKAADFPGTGKGLDQ